MCYKYFQYTFKPLVKLYRAMLPNYQQFGHFLLSPKTVSPTRYIIMITLRKMRKPEHLAIYSRIFRSLQYFYYSHSSYPILVVVIHTSNYTNLKKYLSSSSSVRKRDGLWITVYDSLYSLCHVQHIG